MSLFNLFKKVEPEPAKATQRVDLDNTFYSTKAKTLPQNFAQNLLELQMRLQFSDTCDLELIKQLNQMYKIAIEYYINEDPKKANHFQRKLTNMLANPNTLEVIEKKQKKVQIVSSNYEKQLKNQMAQFNAQSNIVVKSIVEGSEHKVQRYERLINEHISNQEDKLRNRMENRSKSKSRKQI